KTATIFTNSSVTAALRCHTHATCRKKAAEILKVETREADGTPRLPQHPPRARDSREPGIARTQNAVICKYEGGSPNGETRSWRCPLPEGKRGATMISRALTVVAGHPPRRSSSAQRITSSQPPSGSSHDRDDMARAGHHP